MVAIFIQIEGDERLLLGFLKVEELLSDFTTIFEKLSPNVFGFIQKRIDLGGYAALSTAYAARKAALYGSRAILRATDRLYESFKKDAPESVQRISRTEAEFGSSVFYGIYHQEGTSRMPKRVIIDITRGQEAELAEIVMDALGDKFKQLGFKVAA